MTITDIKTEFKSWKLKKYKLINFVISLSGLLIYEFIGRPIYRPYIYANDINDFHIADTLGNTLGTVATIFFFVALLSNETGKGNYLIKLVTVSVVLFEIAHPLLGKPIDVWDIVATVITGGVCFLLYNIIFSSAKQPIDLKNELMK
jgi:hypothetical protein